MENSGERGEQPINVYVRIRPFGKEELAKKCSSCIDVVNKSDIHIRQLYSRKSYRFERVFDSSSSQEDVFDKAVNPLIDEVLKGYNCTVFAYGQTGSGKTHTIVGANDENAGIIPRAVKKLYEILKQNDVESNIRVSFLELYNEELFDLLSGENSKSIRLYDDKNRKGSVILQGLEEMTVSTRDEIYRYLEMGYERRRTAATFMNSQSSRSHCIFTIIVHMREISPVGEDLIKTGKLNLVDLAGSENIGRSGSVDKRAREAGSINQSLLTLGRVIRALTEKSSHIPYRESKLTRILGDSLGGSAKTSLIATISSATINADETANTLEYAVRVRNIQNKPEVNQQLSRSSLIHQYKQEIERLKKDLYSSRMGTGICLNEECYLQMINEQENLKSNLNLKANHVACLEEELRETVSKLEVLEKSWADAANNIETLTHQQRILENKLVLCKDEKDKQWKELEDFKTKHERLVTDSKKLASVVEVQYKNDEILHRKLSSLYDVSHRNKISTNHFYDTYNTLSCAMKNELNSCIDCMRNIISLESESVTTIKTKLNETYTTLKQLMFGLIKNWITLEGDKREYFEMKDVFLSEVGDCINELDQIIEETFTTISASIRKTISENLENTDSVLGEIKENQGSYCKTLVSTLNNIDASIIQSSSRLDDLLEHTQQNAISEHEIIKDLNQEISANINSYRCHTREAKKDMSEGISAIRSHVLALKQKHSASTTVMKKSSEETINLHAKMQKTSDDFRAHVTESFNSIRSEATKYSDQITNTVNKQMETVQEIEEEEICMCEKAKKEIDVTLTKLREQTELSDVLLSDCKISLTALGSSICDREQRYDKYVTGLSELCHSTTDETDAAVKLVDDMYQAVSDVNSRVLRALSDTDARVASTNDRLQENYGQMKKMMHEFSDVKLKCLTHAGDTPKRSHDAIALISSLNISPVVNGNSGKEHLFAP